MNALGHYRQTLKAEDNEKRFERIEEKLDEILKALGTKPKTEKKAASTDAESKAE